MILHPEKVPVSTLYISRASMAEMIMSNSSAACGFCLLSFSFARVVVRVLDVGNYIGIIPRDISAFLVYIRTNITPLFDSYIEL